MEIVLIGADILPEDQQLIMTETAKFSGPGLSRQPCAFPSSGRHREVHPGALDKQLRMRWNGAWHVSRWR